jgi:flavin-dependent dehydrogenase
MTPGCPVAVVGGGPAGAFAASLLARNGHQVTLFDERMAWEKPCGGAVTCKAVETYPFLGENGAPKKIVRECEMTAGGTRVRFTLPDPIYVYSRLTLNELLLERARHAGCRMITERITEVRNDGPGGWSLQGTQQEYRAGYLVVATGARNAFRGLGLPDTAQDTGMTVGYFVPGTQESLEIEFPEKFPGYLWVFPRTDHLSVGICGPLLGEATSAMKERLEEFMQRRGLPREGSRFFSHRLPSLSRPSWRTLRPAGPGWAGVGDAAGLVDPITGEGIYYALRSAELLAECCREGRPERYPYRLRADFGHDLEMAARLYPRVYSGSFLGGAVTTRMVQFAARSGTFRSLMRDVFAGRQGYLGLKHRLLKNLNVSLAEIAASILRLHSPDP